MANEPNSMFLILHFATSFLHIHVEFLNNERGKRKTGDAAACTIDEIRPIIDNFSSKFLF